MGIAPPAIDVTAGERRTVLALLNRHLPNTTAWAYGSRVKWTSRPESDLDLVVFARPEQSALVAELREAFDESDLPFSVDLFVWDDVPESFRGKIERDHVVLADGCEKRTRRWKRGWKEYAVRELIDSGSLEIGDGYRTRNSELAKSGTPFARAGNVRNGFHFDDVDHLPTERLDRIKNKASMPGDVVFTSKGTVGRFAFVQENTPRFVYSPQLCFWRVHDPELIDPRFLFCWMSGREFFDQYKEVAGQTDMAEYVSLRDQRDMRITLPPVREQRAVAHVLGTLDDRIALNRRMNETLEAMARALFRSWFVDFDPVRARMAGRDPGLPGRIADLFPGRLVDSELGRIPEGWTVGRLSDVAVASRKGIRPADFPDETPYIGLKHMPRRSIALVEWESATKVTSDKFIFEKGDLLFGRLRPYFHKVGVAPVNGICSTDIAVLAPRNAAWYGYVLGTISSDDFVLHANRTSTGTRMPRASWNTMGNHQLALPPSDLAAEYEKITRSFFDRILTNVHESRFLSILRDSLLPGLVSGTLRLESAERAG